MDECGQVAEFFGSFAESACRPRPAISTTVTPSAPVAARTHTRRRWMKSEPARPKIAVKAPISAQSLPGCWVTWKFAHSLMPLSKVMEPAPFGSFIVSPGSRRALTMLPFASLNCFIFEVSSWYTFCGMPASTPRLPWNPDSASTGKSSAGNWENMSPLPAPAKVGTKKAEKPSCSLVPGAFL